MMLLLEWWFLGTATVFLAGWIQDRELDRRYPLAATGAVVTYGRLIFAAVFGLAGPLAVTTGLIFLGIVCADSIMLEARKSRLAAFLARPVWGRK